MSRLVPTLARRYQGGGRLLPGSGPARLRAPDRRGYSSRMPYEPPDPFAIAKLLRAQVLQLRALVETDPTRREYQEAADFAAQALARLEAANIVARK